MQKTKIALLTGLSFILSPLSFADTLKDIAVDSLENDLKIEQLENLVMQSIEKNNEVAAEFMPQISFQSGLNYSVKDSKYNLTEYDTVTGNTGVNLSYLLYSKSEDISKQLQSLQAMTDYFNFEEYKQTVLLNISNIYYSVLSNQKILEADKEQYKTIERQYKKVKQMLEVGLSTRVDLAEVKAELDQAASNIISSQNNLDNTFASLYLYTGTVGWEPEDIDFKDKAKFYEDKGFDYWYDILKENNISLKQANLNKSITKENIKLTDSEDDWTVSLTGSVGTSYNELYDDEFENSASIGVSISLPLFDGGKTNSRIKQAQFGHMNAAIDLDYAHRQLIPELKITLNELDSIKRQIKAMEEVVKSTEMSLNAIEASYQVGSRDMVDLMDATTQHFISLKNLYNTQYNYLTKQNELLNLVGIIDLENI